MKPLYLIAQFVLAASVYAGADDPVVYQRSADESGTYVLPHTDKGGKTQPDFMLPDFPRLQPQPRLYNMPTIPAEPRVDQNMPRITPDHHIDAQIRRVYPHIGKGLLKPRFKQPRYHGKWPDLEIPDETP